MRAIAVTPSSPRARPARAARPAAALLVALLMSLAPATGGDASAAKGGGGKGGPKSNSTSSLTVVMVDDRNGNGGPNWADTITFEVTTRATSTPYVELTCRQAGQLVYSAWAGFYPEYPWPGSRLMPLSSPSWQGGAADCAAVLNDGLATIGFHVDP